MTLPLWRVLQLTEDAGTGAQVGLDDYPIFEPNEREGINRKIIEHFYLRDIGQETISIFTFMLRRTMHEIMPTYNQLYLSSRLQFDPLSTYALNTVRDGTATEAGTGVNGVTTTRDGTVSETGASGSDSTTTNSATAGSRAVNFDTPQTALSGNKDYASSAADANSTNASNGTSHGTNTSNGTSTNHAADVTSGTNSSNTSASTTDTSTTTGRQGSANRLLAEFRANILNIDRMLLNDPELTSMFMLVWDSGNEIEPPRRLHLGR